MIPFWFCITFISVYPTVQTPTLQFDLIPFSSKDLILIALSCFYLLPLIRQNSVVSYFKKSWSNSHGAILALMRLTWLSVQLLLEAIYDHASAVQRGR